MRTLPLLLASLVLAAAAAADEPLVPGTNTRTQLSAGIERSYNVYVPASYSGGPVPLVVDIHGLNANAPIQQLLSRWDLLADEKGFIVLYPQGINDRWNAGICCGNPTLDDVAFIKLIVARTKREANIDARRVYVTGLSNGGAMTHRMACEAADLFAAAAPMAFPLPLSPMSSCQPSRPIPLLLTMGLTDALVPYNGNAVFPSATATMDFWRERNGCDTDAYEGFQTSGQARCEVDADCAEGALTGICSIVAQAFPGQFFDGHILYLNPDYDLARVSWEFMSQFSLPLAPPTPLPALPLPLLAALAGLLAATGARRLR